MFAGSAGERLLVDRPRGARAAARSRRPRAASASFPASNGTATVTSVWAASASTRSNWAGVRSSSPYRKTGRPAHGPGSGAQQGDRLAGDPGGVEPAAALAGRLVAGEEGGDVGEVGGALERAGARLDLARADPGRLQLVEQAGEGGGEAGPRRPSGAAARAAAAAPRPRPRRSAGAAGGEDGAGRAARGGGDLAEEGAEGEHRAAQRGARPAELALEGEDVVDGRQDQHRVALERVEIAAPDDARPARVRGSEDQLQRHPPRLWTAAARSPGRPRPQLRLATPQTGHSRPAFTVPRPL